MTIGILAGITSQIPRRESGHTAAIGMERSAVVLQCLEVWFELL